MTFIIFSILKPDSADSSLTPESVITCTPDEQVQNAIDIYTCMVTVTRNANEGRDYSDFEEEFDICAVIEGTLNCFIQMEEYYL